MNYIVFCYGLYEKKILCERESVLYVKNPSEIGDGQLQFIRVIIEVLLEIRSRIPSTLFNFIQLFFIGDIL